MFKFKNKKQIIFFIIIIQKSILYSIEKNNQNNRPKSNLLLSKNNFNDKNKFILEVFKNPKFYIPSIILLTIILIYFYYKNKKLNFTEKYIRNLSEKEIKEIMKVIFPFYNEKLDSKLHNKLQRNINQKNIGPSAVLIKKEEEEDEIITENFFQNSNVDINNKEKLLKDLKNTFELFDLEINTINNQEIQEDEIRNAYSLLSSSNNLIEDIRKNNIFNQIEEGIYEIYRKLNIKNNCDCLDNLNPEKIILAKIGNQVAAYIHFNDFTNYSNSFKGYFKKPTKEDENTIFIHTLATKINFQRNGIMSEAINLIISQKKKFF